MSQRLLLYLSRHAFCQCKSCLKHNTLCEAASEDAQSFFQGSYQSIPREIILIYFERMLLTNYQQGGTDKNLGTLTQTLKNKCLRTEQLRTKHTKRLACGVFLASIDCQNTTWHILSPKNTQRRRIQHSSSLHPFVVILQHDIPFLG